MKNIFFFNKNIVFFKFFKFYNYKIYLHSSHKNLYCILFSFFKFNILFTISTINIFIKKYIFLNFGKFLNFRIYKFLGVVFSNFILNLNIFKVNFKFNHYNKNISLFFNSLKKYLYF